MSNALTKSIARLGAKLEDHTKDAIPRKVALDELTPYANQARKDFDAESLQELAESIRAIGVIEPLLVRPRAGGGYEIIAGERRLRAARLAGLADVPTLVKPMDDETADKIHLAENIHRENLSTLDLAQRVLQDLDAAGGSLAAVARKYNKSPSWVSKLTSIARGGDAVAELVDAGVTADRAVLATVASLERKAPERAKALGDQLKAAPAKADKRKVAEQFMQTEREKRAAPKKPARVPVKPGAEAAAEPDWRRIKPIERNAEKGTILVELAPQTLYSAEFAQMSAKHGPAKLAEWMRHPDERFVFVLFGSSGGPRAYPAEWLRLLAVS